MRSHFPERSSFTAQLGVLYQPDRDLAMFRVQEENKEARILSPERDAVQTGMRYYQKSHTLHVF
jgi:hypothetical protein